MSKIINIGSINIDHVYQVPHFVEPGEPLGSLHYQKGLGGKGLNQSVALYRAGACVQHVACIGSDDPWLEEALTRTGLDCSHVLRGDEPTGHAIIEVDAAGENRILLYAGANATLTPLQIEQALRAPDVSWVLLQNETNCVEEIIRLAHALGKRIVFNPAPCHAGLASLPLEYLGLLVVNEVEMMQLTCAAHLDDALAIVQSKKVDVVLTLGASGARYQGREGQWLIPAQEVAVVDTTAAGDTYIGYLLAGLASGRDMHAAMTWAARAAALTVSRMGAVDAIPFAHQILP